MGFYDKMKPSPKERELRRLEQRFERKFGFRPLYSIESVRTVDGHIEGLKRAIADNDPGDFRR